MPMIAPQRGTNGRTTVGKTVAIGRRSTPA